MSEQFAMPHKLVLNERKLLTVTGVTEVVSFDDATVIAHTELGTLVGELAIVIGIIVGLAGMVLVAFAWPVYKAKLRKERERIAPEVLRLSEELLK